MSSPTTIPASLAGHAVLARPDLQCLAACFGDAGHELRLVGGVVRNALLGLPVTDMDLASPATPGQVLEILRAAGIRAVPTGIEHGTVTAVIDRVPFEITTLRRDVETDGRHATVAFTGNWAEDAARRDFTINAMSARMDGELFDYFTGREDLAAGRVRFVGDAGARIDEDRLRLLRFFRFFAQYGRGAPDEDALAAARDRASGLAALSAERVQAEVLKLLVAARAVECWALLVEHGIIRHLLDEARNIRRLEALAGLEAALDLPGDAIRRLAALLPSGEEPAKAAAQRLKLSTHASNRLLDLAWPPTVPDPTSPPDALVAQLYHMGSDLVADLILLTAAGNGMTAEAVSPAFHAARAWQRPAFPLNGGDVLALGVPAGPDIGRLLKAVEAWWLVRDFEPGRDECLEELERRARGEGP